MTLNDVCEFIVDCPHSTAKDEGVGYPLIRTPNVGRGRLILNDVHRVSEAVYQIRNLRATPQDDDLIMAREAPAGNVAIIKNGEKVCLGQRTVLLRPDKTKVYPDYLAYYLLAPQQQYGLLGTANGATVAHVNIPVIKTLPVSLPSIERQKKAADILIAYDDLIENNQQQIKLLEEAAQRLYKEWFVDLRYPGHENAPVVDGVPDGWKRTIFSERVDVLSGGTPKTSNPEYYNGTIPFYSPKDSDDRFFAFDTETHISEIGLDNCNSKLYPEDTIIITARGTVGKTTILAKPMAMNQSCYALRSTEVSSVYFLFFALRQEIQALKTMANGGVFDTIIVKTFDRINLMTPTDPLIKTFHKLVKPIMEKMKSLLVANASLSEARDRLLPKLMSGEIAV